MTYTSRAVYEFIAKQTNDPIVQRKTCAVSGQEFALYQSDLDFYAKISPTFAGQKFAIPTPTLCPEERQRRRLLFRNERKLYKRKCDATGENIISIYSPDKPYKVYKQDFWWSDKRDPMDYGRDFDFSRTFGEQFGEMMREVPRYSLFSIDCENCDYSNHIWYSKDCYLCFSSAYSESVMYSRWSIRNNNAIDLMYVENSNNSFECTKCHDCSFVFYSMFANNCSHCIWVQYCNGCSYCVWCFWLQNKSYCIENIQYSKEEYEQLIAKIDLQKYKNMEIIYPCLNNSSIDSSIWNELKNTKNVVFWFWLINCSWCKYFYEDMDVTDCYDSYWASNCEMSCELLASPWNFQGFASMFVTHSKNIYHSQLCHASSHLFGCIWLRNKQYCIFNKQYTKEEYEKTVAKIIAHMQETGERGELFHPSLSPFGYNETVAQEYFPLDQNTAHARWYKRQENNYDPVIPAWANVVDRKTGTAWPIDDEAIIKSIFVCEVSWRPYRIITQELAFYRKHKLPLPRKHPDVRHEERMKLRPWRTLYLRKCDKTWEEILSVYPPDYPGKVYSEKAYQEEIYS